MTHRRMIASVAGGLLAIAGATAASAQETMTTLTGTLTREGNTYIVDGDEVDFGPDWYLSSVTTSSDFDDDGDVGTLEAELDGLVGSSVTVEGTRGRGDDVDVFTINGLEYRDPSDEPPPWAGGPLSTGDQDSDRQDTTSDGPPAFLTDDDDGPPPWVGNDGPSDDRNGPRWWFDDDNDD